MRGVKLSKRQRKVSIIPCFLLFKSILKSALASIPYPELLAYAQSLSAFTSAPPNMPDLSQPGQLPPPLFFPPFPNEEKMRRGRLNAEAPLGILGETHSVGRRESRPLNCLTRSHLDLHYQLRPLLPKPWMQLLLVGQYTDRILVYCNSRLTLISISTRICEHALSTKESQSAQSERPRFWLYSIAILIVDTASPT